LVYRISVIASLKPELTGAEICPQNPIAAGSLLTFLGAGIGIHEVPVITALTRVHDAIAA
jgi:hypothetical protein